MAITHPQIAVNAEAEAEHARAEVRSADFFGTQLNDDSPKDHFKSVDGVRFAGSHLIIDMWQAEHLDDEDVLRRAMSEAVDAAGATLLHLHLHRFTPFGGISGVAVLAESHISVHTWPERGYAAFDIFMCGDAQPEIAAAVLERALRPERSDITEHRRGTLPPQ